MIRGTAVLGAITLLLGIAPIALGHHDAARQCLRATERALVEAQNAEALHHKP